MRCWKPYTSGFTLVELLVVIAIIGVLSSVLFPVFSRAKQDANRTLCASNLKQLAAALDLYAQDWNSNYPSAGIQKSHSYYTQSTSEQAYSDTHTYFCRSSYLGSADVGWTDVIAPYIANSDVVWCPSRGTWPGYPRTSYEYKLWFAYNTRRDAVLNPSGMALVWEQWAYHAEWEPENDKRASLNVAFVDGHVEYKRMADATTADWPNGPDLHGFDSSGRLLPSPYPRSDFAR